ncbi:hypothetical protein EII31_00120 [Leucobacter sp. OH2974_COT-288]|nr:hypothetical protein EII31_00120 [Leucobacter sp. OH2974_COT-288]
MSSTVRKPDNFALPAKRGIAVPAKTAAPAPISAPASNPTRQLQPVTAPRRKHTVMPYLVGALAVCFIGAQMVISNLTSKGAYELDALKKQERDTLRVERVLAQNALALTSPQNLADNARSLGMVENIAPSYLRLSDGVILGAPSTEVAPRPVANLVPNATLHQQPVINEVGEVVARDSAAAAATAATAAAGVAVVWEGELPAPQTR